MLFNPLIPLPILVAAGILLSAVTIVYRVYKNPLSRLPGPQISKWTDVVLKYYWLIGKRAAYVHSLHQIYGPIVRVSPTEVDISDIGAVKKIHSIKDGFLKSPWYQQLVPIFKNVFNVSDVDFHRRHRRLLSSPLSESSLKLLEPFVNDKVTLAVEGMKKEMKSRGAADVYKWLFFMATDIIGELSFGESFRMLEQGKSNQYIMDLQELATLGGIATTFPLLIKVAKSLPLPIFRGPAESSKRMIEYSNQSIQRYKNLVAGDPSNPKPMLFKKLFKAGEEGLSDIEIRDEAVAYIVAGSDTTANTLTYLVWSVSRNEQVKRRLVEELSLLADDFGDANLRDLPYLNQVIEETLRLYPAAPSALPRTVPPGGSTLGGYWVPGGATVSTQAWTLHRNPAAFPSPETFDPSRWEAPTKMMKESFMPFGGGSRVCLGLHLASMELRLATARFFRAFPHASVSNLEGFSEEDMVPVAYFLLSPKGKRCLIQEQ